MVIKNYEISYKGNNLIAVSTGLISCRVVKDGTLKSLRIDVTAANTSGDTVFNIKLNGIDQFSGGSRPKILQNDTYVEVSSLSIAVVRGDKLLVTVESIASGGVIAPIDIIFDIEEPGVTEEIQDIVAAMLAGNSQVSYNDTTGAITISDDVATTEQLQDKVAALLQEGTGVTITYDDSGNTLTLESTGGGGGSITDEEFQDKLNALVTAGANISLNYNDASDIWEIEATSGGGGSSGNVHSVDAKPSGSIASECDYFEGSSLDAKWTRLNGTASTMSVKDGVLKFSKASGGGDNGDGIFQPLPSGNCTIITKVTNPAAQVSFCLIALALFQDATGNPTSSDIIAFRTTKLNSDYAIGVVKYNDITLFNTVLTTAQGLTNMLHDVMYLRASRNGTNWQFSYSTNGEQWANQGSAISEGSHFTPAEFGILVDNLLTGVTNKFKVEFVYYEAAANADLPGGLV